jgi:hypothetical protein
VGVPLLGRGWARLDLRTAPVDLLPELERLESFGPDSAAIFNEMGFGGFLLYYTPGFRLFIDDRCELYGDRRLMDYCDALYSQPERLEEWTRQYGFHIALVGNNSLFDQYLSRSAEWHALRRGETATLYQRTPSAAEQ